MLVGHIEGSGFEISNAHLWVCPGNFREDQLSMEVLPRSRMGLQME